MSPPRFITLASPATQPNNFDNKFMGPVTLRDAMAHSLNVATVKVAQMVGFDSVVEMANRAGMNYKIQPTPAVALGVYEITPLEAVGAYTIFANGGDYLKPSFLTMVRAQDGKVVYKNKVEEKQVLDPRVAYLATNLMEKSMRSGTPAEVRPVAGTTGISRDGWFAGFTSELLCIVWVGFDDNRDLGLNGATSAAPIWGELCRARWYIANTAIPSPLKPPNGISSIDIIQPPDTWLLRHAPSGGPRCSSPGQSH